MARFDRYMLSQLVVVFGFFSLVLILVYWVNRAVGLFDQLIASGQSALVFLEFTALSLPNLIRLVLPISAFGAAVYVTNRLASESELVVVQSTGYSPFRMARPVLIFGVFVGVLVAILTNVLAPAATRQLDMREDEIAENITARLLTEGEFLHPADGITFYIREISPEGELRDIFLADARARASRTTYTARRALLIRGQSGPQLVMFDGLAQTLDLTDKRLATTSFSDFVYDIGALIRVGGSGSRRPSALPTRDLLFPSPAILEETGDSPSKLVQMGHERISQALLCPVVALVGFAALLIGGFSRFGLWRQVIGAIVALVVLESLDNAMIDVVRRDAALWPLMYLASVLGLGVAAAMLWVSAWPGLFRRRRELSA